MKTSKSGLEESKLIVEQLVHKASMEYGVLSYDEIRAATPPSILNSTRFEAILVALAGMDIEIVDNLTARCMRFIEQIKLRNKITLIPYCEEKWFQGAYSTIQRTLRDSYKPLSANQKVLCGDIAIGGICNLKAGSFDDECRNLINLISRKFHLSIGHAQKLISILMKYAFCVYHTKPNELPGKWQRIAQDCKGQLLAPVDAIALRGLNSCAQFRPDSPAIEGAYIIIEGKRVPWSKLNSYAAYWTLQQHIRNLARKRKMTPLELEMTHLWK